MWYKTGFGIDDFHGIVKAESPLEARHKWYQNRCDAGFKETIDEEGGFDQIWAEPLNADEYLVIE